MKRNSQPDLIVKNELLNNGNFFEVEPNPNPENELGSIRLRGRKMNKNKNSNKAKTECVDMNNNMKLNNNVNENKNELINNNPNVPYNNMNLNNTYSPIPNNNNIGNNNNNYNSYNHNYNINNYNNNNFNNNNYNNNNYNNNNYNAPQNDNNINNINEKFENINLHSSEQQENCNNSLLSENENPEDLSFEEATELNRLSYIVADEEMPKEIHKHPIIKSSLNEEMCIICLKVRTCNKGRKCKNCPLKICEKCVKLVISQYYLNDKHNHNLLLSEVDNWECDMCKKKNNEFKSNFCFYCDLCKFAICLQCYFPKIDDDEEYHEHPLIKGSYENFVCKYCKKEAKEGHKCNECGLEICDICYNKIISYRKKSKLHNHKMYLNERKNWTCNLCKNTFDGIISFYCKECNLDYCLDCFLDNY
jgi:hypothetical protein